jgi:Peptidase family S41
MLRLLYRWLLRLHPPYFRKRFSADMQWIFDQADGNLAQAKLLADGVASLARQRTLRSGFWHEPVASPVTHPLPDGVPLFYTFDTFRPRVGALMNGAIVSVFVLWAVCLAMQYSWNRTLPRWTASFESRTGSSSMEGRGWRGPGSRVGKQASSGAARARQIPKSWFETVSSLGRSLFRARAPETSRQGSTSPAPGRAPQTTDHTQEDAMASGQPAMAAQVPQLTAQNAARGTLDAGVAGMKVDDAERRRVIAGTIANLKAHYVDPGAAQRMADALLRHAKNGDDNTDMDGAAFADLLTRQVRDVSRDQHLIVVYSEDPLPARPTSPTANSRARYRKAMEQENCMFEKVEIRPNNIGYLKLNFFPDTSVCQSTASAAMASLNHADAIIFDLQDNSGGFPGMVTLIASYLFDHPEYMYNPREAPTQHSWTLSPVPGNRLADKPAYVLTSAKTLSGAEQFCYDLKMVKRATVVGETTGGAAHAWVWHVIDDHFGMGIPETKTINPFAHADWVDGRGARRKGEGR